MDYDLAGVVERGDQIVDSAQKFLPDVVTLDVAMPGRSGLHALPRLRSMLPNAIIVVISSTATPAYMREAFARGAESYLEKGGRVPSDLLTTITSPEIDTVTSKGPHNPTLDDSHIGTSRFTARAASDEVAPKTWSPRAG